MWKLWGPFMMAITEPRKQREFRFLLNLNKRLPVYSEPPDAHLTLVIKESVNDSSNNFFGLNLDLNNKTFVKFPHGDAGVSVQCQSSGFGEISRNSLAN